MQRRIITSVCIAALCGVAAFAASAQSGSNATQPVLAAGAEDFGANASDEQGRAMLADIEKKFGGVMRSMYGWTDYSFQRLYDGYKNYPVAVLKRALDAASYESMMSTFDGYTTYLHQRAMQKAFPGRRAYALNETVPGEENNPVVVEAKQAATKALGDVAKDLVFIPITPCTTWDTRFAADGNSAGVIANGATKSFQAFLFGSSGNFSTWGGNPSCTEANATTAGGTPVAVMMTVYINNASTNGWLTLYRYGDPDPSQATISVYYAPGPTRTQTVISKVNGGAYDISATSRYGSTDASASVVGYFMRSPATALDCTTVSATGTAAVSTDSGVSLPACAAGYTRTGGSCYGAAFTGTGYLLESGPNVCWFRNLSSTSTFTMNAVSTCCRVPGR